MALTLLSTVVAPAFVAGRLELRPLGADALCVKLQEVTRNLCGHPVTNEVLRRLAPDLPEAERGFWDGSGLAIAVRPRGGVRASTTEGDTAVTLADLEACFVRWVPAAAAPA